MDYMGLRIARWRDIAGLTQQELGERVGVSGAYVSMIENGERALTKRSRLIAFATALGVSVTDLTAQPLPPRGREEYAIHRLVPTVRVALDDQPPEGFQRWPVERLRAEVGGALAARMACDYTSLAATLPDLVRQARALAEAGNMEGQRLFGRAAGTAAMTIKSFGHVDLGMRLAERTQRAAAVLGEPVEIAWGEYVFAQTALAAGLRARSYAVAASAAEGISDVRTPAAIACAGMLHLHAALAGASLGRADHNDHYAEALAATANTTADPWRVEFSETNARIWRVGIALENGEPESAPEHARRVDRSKIRTAHRRARLHIDAGRGHYLAGQPRAAVRSFLAADEIAASEVRMRPQVREIVGHMIRDARRAGGHEELRQLATRLGMDPLDPVA